MIKNYAQKGFTLFELIVVLIIVSLISSIVGPRLANSLGKVNAKTAAKKIAAYLRYTRTKAVSEKISYVSIFDFDNNRLIIQHYTQEISLYELDEKQSQIYDLPDNVFFEKCIAFNGDKFYSKPFYIVFYPNGGTSGGQIFIIDDRKRHFIVNVDFITGIVDISNKEQQ